MSEIQKKKHPPTLPDAATESLENGNFREASALLLAHAREQTESDFGFVGIILNGELLRLLATEGFHWHETINREFYESMMSSFREQGYLDFLETHNLIGRAIIHREVVLTNSPSTDPRSGGVPPGHPALHSFLGMPAVRNGAVIGMIGLANRKNGYGAAERATVELLIPFLAALYDCYCRSLGSSVTSFLLPVYFLKERRRADEEGERLRQAQADLAHISRVTTMGELTASLAHELNQPITAALADADTCLSWLNRDQPNLEEACEAVSRIVKDATCAAEIISRIRLLFEKGTAQWELIDLNEVIREITALLRGELRRHSISVTTELDEHISQIMGDRVQLQQVMLNLIVNSVEAMKDVDGMRELAIKSEGGDNQQLMVSVSDTGLGLPEQKDQIFDAFFTTKIHGIGLGLRISRSIIESHGGRLWAADNSPRGAIFYLTLPPHAQTH